jgi:hypothetical protein
MVGRFDLADWALTGFADEVMTKLATASPSPTTDLTLMPILLLKNPGVANISSVRWAVNQRNTLVLAAETL